MSRPGPLKQSKQASLVRLDPSGKLISEFEVVAGSNNDLKGHLFIYAHVSANQLNLITSRYIKSEKRMSVWKWSVGESGLLADGREIASFQSDSESGFQCATSPSKNYLAIFAYVTGDFVLLDKDLNSQFNHRSALKKTARLSSLVVSDNGSVAATSAETVGGGKVKCMLHCWTESDSWEQDLTAPDGYIDDQSLYACFKSNGNPVAVSFGMSLNTSLLKSMSYTELNLASSDAVRKLYQLDKSLEMLNHKTCRLYSLKNNSVAIVGEGNDGAILVVDSALEFSYCPFNFGYIDGKGVVSAQDYVIAGGDVICVGWVGAKDIDLLKSGSLQTTKPDKSDKIHLYVVSLNGCQKMNISVSSVPVESHLFVTDYNVSENKIVTSNNRIYMTLGFVSKSKPGGVLSFKLDQ